jgi:hypothetical protein
MKIPVWRIVRWKHVSVDSSISKGNGDLNVDRQSVIYWRKPRIPLPWIPKGRFPLSTVLQTPIPTLGINIEDSGYWIDHRLFQAYCYCVSWNISNGRFPITRALNLNHKFGTCAPSNFTTNAPISNEFHKLMIDFHY